MTAFALRVILIAMVGGIRGGMVFLALWGADTGTCLDQSPLGASSEFLNPGP